MDTVADLGAEHVVDEPVLGESGSGLRTRAALTTALKW